MALYKISGVWKDSNGVIIYYAIHDVSPLGRALKATKKSKTEVITLLEIPGNSAVTWLWSYNHSKWINGENISIVGTGSSKYLRSNPDNKVTDNLGHLIDYDLIPLSAGGRLLRK